MSCHHINVLIFFFILSSKRQKKTTFIFFSVAAAAATRVRVAIPGIDIRVKIYSMVYCAYALTIFHLQKLVGSAITIIP